MRHKLFDKPFSELTPDETRALAAIAQSGICVHSFQVVGCVACQLNHAGRVLKAIAGEGPSGLDPAYVEGKTPEKMAQDAMATLRYLGYKF